MRVEDLGNTAYAEAWRYQQQLFDNALQQKQIGEPVQNTLLLCEHPHTITLGRNAHENNLLFNETFLSERGVALFRIDRGGDVTYHGPGQVVGYPIFDLETYNIGLKQYIYLLEEAIIRLLALYNIAATRLERAAGVWLDVDNPARTRKIAAIGVRCSRFVTMHGFALNVNTDLSYFSLINPCGFVDKGVTSMQQELGREVDEEAVKDKLKTLFDEIFVQSTF
ncbi:lipoyl(octanoyl) transferase LipB [Dysgonomonas sp. 25]|uniref:lipoyl(octanoyl) transferase LipB n=1 Tax=Dysgonomonas sp. 25 TaxID=2302933 RepID=UPI0013D5B5AF|nr:lipoyl(octanoyl) transferase LipB [Dysgonomonas sp. 25]NDV69221.1 lipoyl(octanoyl) transferase LipB [Dysgonomonas sp. 25]